jgi:hypothetical protein
MAKPSKPIGAVAINVLARVAAKKAVQEQLKAQGVRVALVKPADIAAQAKAYLDANPHLYEEAYSRAWRMGLIEQAERIDQALFDDERRKPALTPDWRRSALFATLHSCSFMPQRRWARCSAVSSRTTKSTSNSMGSLSIIFAMIVLGTGASTHSAQVIFVLSVIPQPP